MQKQALAQQQQAQALQNLRAQQQQQQVTQHKQMQQQMQQSLSFQNSQHANYYGVSRNSSAPAVGGSSGARGDTKNTSHSSAQQSQSQSQYGAGGAGVPANEKKKPGKLNSRKQNKKQGLATTQAG